MTTSSPISPEDIEVRNKVRNKIYQLKQSIAILERKTSMIAQNQQAILEIDLAWQAIETILRSLSYDEYNYNSLDITHGAILRDV